MNAIDLTRMARVVSAGSRSRGETYAARPGCVRIAPRKGPDDPVRAKVVGSRLYEVEVRSEGNVLAASCTCPHASDQYEICKHIWATLLVCERTAVLFPRPMIHLTLDESFPDDQDDLEEGYEDNEPGSNEPIAQRNNVVPIQRNTQPASRWRWQLDSVVASPPRRSLPTPEITWIIDPTLSGSGLTLDITSRQRNKDGQPGKPRTLRIERNSIADIASPLDREIVAIIGAATYSYGVLDTRVSLVWPFAEYVVANLAGTGRLLVRLEDKEYGTIDSFDAGEPWRLAVHAVVESGRYLIAGTIRRGEETIPLRQALAVTPGGLVIFRHSIARFADEGTHGWAALLLRERLEVPALELNDFLKRVTTSRAPLAITLPSGEGPKERRVTPRAILELRQYDYGSTGGVPIFEYDGHAVNALEESRAVVDARANTIYPRDEAEELRKLEAFRAAFEGQRIYSDYVGGVTFPSKSLPVAIPKLMAAGWEVRGTEGTYTAAVGELELEVTSGIDWFDVEGSIRFGDEEVRLPRLLAALQKGSSLIALEGGRVGVMRAEWLDQIEPFLAAATDRPEGGLRFRGNQVLLLDALLANRAEIGFDTRFEQARRRILDVKLMPGEARPTFRGSLRPYQCEGLGWFAFLREIGFGGCLADDMGLGKTIQVLALLDQRQHAIREEGKPRPSLVVAPRSVVFNWKAEAARFTPELRVLDHSTPDRIRAVDHFGDYDLVLTTYALLRKEAELFAGIEFDYVILDEAQSIKNATSQAAKAALLLRARHRLALSGTPVENHLGELASLFEFLNPGMLQASSPRVKKMLRNAGTSTPEGASARAILARAVRPFILRRTKSQVARELPDRVEQTLWCELEPKQRKLYDELRDYFRVSLAGEVASKGLSRSKIKILEALLRMRQAACHPGLIDKKRVGEPSAKLDALFEELPTLIEGGHKVLIFSQFTSLLAIVQTELKKRGLSYAYLDGRSRDREAQVRRFQEDPTLPLFLISLKAGGLGLNLTAAEYVFLLDPWWNPAVEAQAIDRAHRIGQTRNVVAYRLVARDTIEEKILQLQQSKRDLADAIIGEENSILRQLTAADLDLLLS